MEVAEPVAERVARMRPCVLLWVGVLHLVLLQVHREAPAAPQRPDQHRAVDRVDQQGRAAFNQRRAIVVDRVHAQRQPVVGLDLDALVAELLAEGGDDRLLVVGAAVGRSRVRREHEPRVREPLAHVGAQALLDQALGPVAALHQLAKHQDASEQVLLHEDHRRAREAGVEPDDQAQVAVEAQLARRDVQLGAEGLDDRGAADREAPLGFDELLDPLLRLPLRQVLVVAPGQVLDVLGVRGGA